MTDASGGQVDRVLVLYYSQSGEVADIASLFTTELSRTGVEVTIERLDPETAYPYPWRSIRRFFDAMPESVLGLPPPIRLPGYDPTSRFRLVVLVSRVTGAGLLSPAARRSFAWHRNRDDHRQPRHVAEGFGKT